MGFSIQIHSSLRPTGDANFHFAHTICKLYIIVHTRYTHGYCTYPVYPWLLTGPPQSSESRTKRSGEASEPRAGRAARAWTTGRQPEPRVRSALNNAGLRPSLHPVFGSTFLRGVSRSLSKRGVPRLRPRHTAHPPIGSELPHRFSCQPWRRRGSKNPRTLGVGFLGLYPRVLGPLFDAKRVVACSVGPK